MKRPILCALVLALITILCIPSPLSIESDSQRVSLVPYAEAATKPTKPTGLSIPSIDLKARIVPMGITKSGDLDVPSGTTRDVGWYAKGTVPGNTGSAVLDAHVFAAFKDLEEVRAGDDIYVDMKDGTTRHFVVTKARLFKLADLSPDELFNDDSGRMLHLITCAGQLTADKSTYTHRLVVYATLKD